MLRVIAALAVGASAQANAINKIVEQLEDMKATVIREGETTVKEFEEHQEWCRRTIQGTGYKVKDATEGLEAAQALMADSDAKGAEAQQSITDLAGKIAKDAADLDAATKLREKENGDFQKSEQELVDTVDTLVRAASIVRKATGGAGSAGASARLNAALTQIAGSLEVVMQAAFINADSKKKLQALLQQEPADDDDDAAAGGYVQPTAAAYESKSGGIVDLLADLKQEAEGQLGELRKSEANAQHAFNMLRQSLEDAGATDKRSLGDSKTLLAEQQEVNAKSTEEAQNQEKTKKENEGYLADTQNECQTAVQEHEAEKADRENEVVALAKAIEILTQSSFKGAVDRRGVFLQTKQAPDVRSEVAELLKKAASKFASVEFAQLAVHAADDPFAKVKDLIKDMVSRLQKQAAEEADHKAYCDSERKKNVAKRDDQSSKLDKYSTRLDKSRAEEAQLKQDIAKISDEMVAADANMAAATKLRNEQASTFVALKTDCETGLSGISQAIAVLKDYYSQAGENAKSDSATNVVAFLETAESDMLKMKTEAETQESEQAEAFDKMKNEQEVLKASNEATLKGKQGEVTRLGGLISDVKNDVESTQAELDATLEYLEKLKDSCTAKVMSFEERAAKMQQEIESLQQALEILENETAGESFLQRK